MANIPTMSPICSMWIKAGTIDVHRSEFVSISITNTTPYVLTIVNHPISPPHPPPIRNTILTRLIIYPKVNILKIL